MRLLILTAVLVNGLSATCRGQLTPEELVVIAARGDRDSESLANYYAKIRNVPAENICLVKMPSSEVCRREVWHESIRPEIHKWLVEHDPQKKIRCLVTVWGVPLKISPAAANDDSKRYREFLEAERDHRLKLLAQVLDSFDKVAPEGNATNPASETPSSPDQPSTGPLAQQSPEMARMQTRLEVGLQRAQARLVHLPEDERKSRQMELQRLAAATGGFNVILAAMNERLKSDDAGNSKMRAEFDAMRGRIGALVELKALLEQMPADIERDALVLGIIERFAGLLGAVQWLDQQLQITWRDETGASFDSELSLVMWPDGYQLLRWQPNYLHASYHNSQLPTFKRTLMVSRIDAPTLKLAKALIDTAVEVEKQGLRGKVYLDARGLAKIEDASQPPGSFGDYDRNLLLAAQDIRKQTDLEVVTEDTPQLFQPGQCPEAALYCGWLSQAKYVDAFDWAPGAVAYHLGSSEASSLRDPDSQAWCKKLLEDGVCATIGPVYEPYLPAFPRPQEFFIRLVRGDLTLVEVYYLTQPFTSWTMTLIGDPLYRPFKYRAPATPPPHETIIAPKRKPLLPLPPGSEEP